MKFPKNKLIEILTANRAKHRAVFEEALENYRKTQVEHLERAIAIIRGGKVVREAVVLPVPFDATREYDKALRMLELTTQEEVELTDEQFAALVMDDWAWRRQFAASNTRYVTSELAAAYVAQE